MTRPGYENYLLSNLFYKEEERFITSAAHLWKCMWVLSVTAFPSTDRFSQNFAWKLSNWRAPQVPIYLNFIQSVLTYRHTNFGCLSATSPTSYSLLK
jgi:hypothetical protein